MSADLHTHTDTTAEQHWTARRVLAHVLEGRDYEHRLSSQDLAQYVDPGPSAVRDLIGDLRRDFGLAVYSFGSGYFHIQSDEELDRAIEKINDRIETAARTKRELTDAYNATNTTMTRQRPPAPVFARSTRDTSDEYFEARVENTDDLEYLREMAVVEGEGPAREERLATINQRIAEVRDE